MDDTVTTFEDIDVITDAYITVEVFLALFVKRTPSAEITPPEVCRTDEDLLSLLHNGVVDGDVLTFGEQAVDLFLFLSCSVDWQHGFKDLSHCGLVDAEGIDDGVHIPDEDTGIPEEVILFDVFLSSLQIGLFAEGIYTENLLVAEGTVAQVCLDITVTCFRAIRFHT